MMKDKSSLDGRKGLEKKSVYRMEEMRYFSCIGTKFPKCWNRYKSTLVPLFTGQSIYKYRTTIFFLAYLAALGFSP